MGAQNESWAILSPTPLQLGDHEAQLFQPQSAAAEPFPATEIATRLRAYLSNHLPAATLHFAQAPTLLQSASGWETFIYRFQLRPTPALPPAWTRPLILRIYGGPAGVSLAEREFAAQAYLHRVGYPVAEPLALEEASERFGGPFLVMELIDGPSPYHYLQRRPWNILFFPRQLAKTHAWLHGLPVDGFPRGRGPLLNRRLKEMAELIDEFQLHGLTAGWHWLTQQQPTPPERPCILHLDFHPLNLVMHADKSLVVLDWNHADVGDYHADLGTLAHLVECVPVREAKWHERFLEIAGRPLLLHLYLHAYRLYRPVDAHKLNYYRAWAALHRLCNYGKWLQAGSCVDGLKASLAMHLSPAHVRVVCRYFEKWTKVAVHL